MLIRHSSCPNGDSREINTWNLKYVRWEVTTKDKISELPQSPKIGCSTLLSHVVGRARTLGSNFSLSWNPDSAINLLWTLELNLLICKMGVPPIFMSCLEEPIKWLANKVTGEPLSHFLKLFLYSSAYSVDGSSTRTETPCCSVSWCLAE